MPPINTYIFNHYTRTRMSIVIEAYSENSALEILKTEVVNPDAYYLFKTN